MKFQLFQQSHVTVPANIFWILLHCLCCLISLILGFRFSRLIFFLLLSNSNSNSDYNTTPFAVDIASTLTFTTSLRNELPKPVTSKVVVGRHGIRIRPWPHPNAEEVMKAHRIIESVQKEQKVQYGIKNPRSLIVVTPTYVRTFQALHLNGLMHTLMNLPFEVVWVVVEAGGVTNETDVLLRRMKNVRVVHIGFEKKMPVFWSERHKMESEMRLQALRVVREEKLDGIVMFADDSNMHSLELFDEIQKVEWIGAVSVGILVHTSSSDEDPFEVQKKSLNEKHDKKTSFPIQGPACNASDQLIGWHTFDSAAYEQKRASYIGDMAIVLPRKLEWCGFVMNSRVVWEESEFRPEWIKDLDNVVAAGNEIENPLSFVEDTSMVETLGSCGKKVMMWWLRAEARADSKFPSGWTIDPPLEVTVEAKRTPWPDATPEQESNTAKATQEKDQKHPTKTKTPRSRRRSRDKRKHANTRVLPTSSGETSEK